MIILQGIKFLEEKLKIISNVFIIKYANLISSFDCNDSCHLTETSALDPHW